MPRENFIYLLLAINALTFVVYALDKHRARKGYWRTSENTLLLFALIGGSPAALLARKLFRHKTAKRSFILRFRLIMVFQFIIIVLLLCMRII